ncbi:MAG TPA: AMP-binding protein [Puia sp.]|nr:AMP-binding protein [Puia sp.]
MGSTEILFQPADRIRSMQEQRLRELMAYTAARSPFYRELAERHRIDFGAIRALEDLTAIPPTTKEDLQRRNEDFLCVPRERVAEYTTTSGTLGSPVTIALTAGDLDRLAYNEYHSFLCADGTPSDVYQLMLTLDRQFMAGIAYYSGIRRLGAGVIRVGPGVPALQWETIRRLRPTVLVAVPSFLLKLIAHAKESQIDLGHTSVRSAICIGENIRQADLSLNILGRKIREAWDIRLYSTYASTEMQTAFTECREGRGGHLQPELLIAELLDDRDMPVGPGIPGEVTVTTLGIEGMPLIRYKTGDICTWSGEPCACGRTSLRLSPIIGRRQQMIKFKGTTLYPPALFELLNEMEEVSDYVVEVYSNEVGLDEIRLHLAPASRSEDCDHRIRAYLQARLRVSPHISYPDAAELQKMQFPEAGRKAIKFLDRRSDNK